MGTDPVKIKRSVGIKELGSGRQPIALERARGTLEPWAAHGEGYMLHKEAARMGRLHIRLMSLHRNLARLGVRGLRKRQFQYAIRVARLCIGFVDVVT